MTEVTTTVKAVTVYPDRARVVRQGAAQLELGLHRLIFTGLPMALDPASVRATASGTAPARLRGVNVRREFYEVTPVADARALEERLEAQQDELAALESEHTLLKEQRAVTQNLAGATDIYARGLAYGKLAVADQMTLLNDLQARAAELDQELLALGVRRRDLKRRIEKTQRELQQLQGARGRERFVAEVEVELAAAGELTVDLVYVITNAGWTPLYDLRLSDAEGQPPALEVGYLAQVTQRTGEDWRDAALTLSTARPALSETLPELKPWYVTKFVPLPPAPAPGRPRMAKMAVARADEDSFAAAMADEESEERIVPKVAAEAVVATVESSGTAVTYRVPGAVTIPADGAPHKVTVAVFTLKPTLDYVAAPKLTEAVYRRAEAENASPYTLLAGKANLFAGEEFIGVTALDLIAPGGKFELYLGVDDRIKIKRELARREVDKKFIGDKRRLRYGYEIRLDNRLPDLVKLTLHDQLPVSRDELIKVRLESAEPKPTEETQLGLLRWELTLAPREERAVRFEFSAEHPRDIQVIGLP